jgi:hypothetical protein
VCDVEHAEGRVGGRSTLVARPFRRRNGGGCPALTISAVPSARRMRIRSPVTNWSALAEVSRTSLAALDCSAGEAMARRVLRRLPTVRVARRAAVVECPIASVSET